MALYKEMQSDGVVALGSGDQSQLFQKGFKFVLGRSVYRVVKSYRADNTEMREIIADSGDVEIVTVDTLLKDAKSPDFSVIETQAENTKNTKNTENTEKSENS